MYIEDLISYISQIIYDKKGFNILALDLKNVSTFTDYVIIAEASVQRHVRAIALEIIDKLKQKNQRPVYIEGMQEADWVVLDYIDIVIHIFKPGLREKYQLEKLWQEAQIIDLKIEVES